MDRKTYINFRKDFWNLMAENGYIEVLPTKISANVFWPAFDKLKNHTI